MPTLYLSPSTQEFNPYVTGGSEERWMNLLADAMEPMLLASGISFRRNSPGMTAASSIRASNEGQYDLHLALHSNASAPSQAGENRGILAFYFPGSDRGRRAADLLADSLRAIYPLPDLVRAEPTGTLGEVRRVRAPAVLLELGFHDNYEDALWITSHINAMAEAIVLALTVYFGIPFFPVSTPVPGRIQVEEGVVSVYSRPDFSSPPRAFLYDETRVTVQNSLGPWDLIRFGEEFGYVPREFIRRE